MSRWEEHHVSDASTKSETRSPLRAVASDNSLHLSDDSGARKRKRDGSTMDDLLRDPFVMRPYPSNTCVKPRTLQPLILLPRSQLPLSSLDIVSSAKNLAQSRLFEAHVKILELEERMGSQPMMLVARLDDGRTLCAVERESRGLYVLCQLGSWVNLQDLKAAAVASKQEFPKIIQGGSLGNDLTNAGQVPIVTPESSKYNKKKRLAIEAIQSMVKRPSISLSGDSQVPIIEQDSAVDPQPTCRVIDAPRVAETISQPSAAEIFESVRTMYFETLYLSKASLAYFAKGPLSRARAAFHLDYDSSLDLNDYIAFLESLVMSTTLIDKKYRDGIPNCVSLIDIHDNSADDVDQSMAKNKKRKSNRKMKPGKNGLYPTEDALIRRWWSSHDDDTETGASGSSREELAKRLVSELRIRETQLQMIIILEVLALQPLVSTTEDVGMVLPNSLPLNESTDVKDKSIKSKKPDHLAMLIDVHIDRLCIWQSIALEAVKTLSAEVRTAPENSNNLSKNVDSILRDFCVEVIAPFFSSRLPDRCATINRKLGGPVAISPPKPKLSKSASFSGTQSRPGAATKRPVPVKPRRSLQRILTDDRERRSMSRGPSKAIALMRSATMPMISVMKREGSEAPSLSSIPAVDLQALEANRGGVLKSKRFSQREVDLSSLAPEINAKAKKQASIDAELKEAISALKKPNRELAGKVLVDNAEKRSASASQSRKSKKPTRNPLFQGVQISATPKANRRKIIFSEHQNQNPARFDETESPDNPPWSLPRIPQSASRPSAEELSGRKSLFSSIQATPTRKPASTFPRPRGGLLKATEVDYASCLQSSPLHMPLSSASLFPLVPDSSMKSPSDSLFPGIQETPVKKGRDLRLDHGHPSLPRAGSDKENDGIEDGSQSKSGGGTADEISIYKALGWDNAYEVDDLV